MIYIFDFDGTLVDSMPYFTRVFYEYMDEKGIRYPDNIINILTPLGYEGIAQYLIGLGATETKEEIIEEIQDRVAYCYFNTIPAKEFVPEKLRELRENGHSLNVLTASPHRFLEGCLGRIGIYELFDNVWSCDDFAASKKDEKIYHAVSDRLGCKVTDCIFIDDNIDAISTAKKAGMTAVGVFDKSSEELADKMKLVCDRYIYSFDELVY